MPDLIWFNPEKYKAKIQHWNADRLRKEYEKERVNLVKHSFSVGFSAGTTAATAGVSSPLTVPLGLYSTRKIYLCWCKIIIIYKRLKEIGSPLSKKEEGFCTKLWLKGVALGWVSGGIGDAVGDRIGECVGTAVEGIADFASLSAEAVEDTSDALGDLIGNGVGNVAESITKPIIHAKDPKENESCGSKVNSDNASKVSLASPPPQHAQQPSN